MTRKEIFNLTLNAAHCCYDGREAMAVAERYCSDLYGFGRFDVAMDGEAHPEGFDEPRFRADLERLRGGEPVQYVVGHTDFLGRRFVVRPGVLIPRPETEELVAKVLEECCLGPKVHILDIGTGSGAIAVSLAAECAGACVDALELSPVAAAVAEENARLNGVDVRVLRCDVFDFAITSEAYDVVISNPPYIPIEECEQMDVNVREFEPHEALFVPNHTPLIFYERIAEVAQRGLVQGGWLCLEIHSPLAEATAAMLRERSFVALTIHADLNSKPRMILCQKR